MNIKKCPYKNCLKKGWQSKISENKEITIYYKFNILNMGKEDNKLQNVG